MFAPKFQLLLFMTLLSRLFICWLMVPLKKLCMASDVWLNCCVEAPLLLSFCA